MTVDAQILRSLRTASEQGVSGAELSNRLGISRTAIWARIEELRKLGYEIEASPHRGYRLLNSPDLLHADDLMAQLDGNQIVGREIHVFQETTSTNDIAEKLARDGVREGVVIIAESQTKGRGRLGRRWESPKGRGLWFSVLLRPALPPGLATQFTVAAATALVRGIRAATAVKPEIKWPNDILIRGRKVAGVLTEMSAEPDSIRHITLGIGVDVNLAENEFPAELRKIATSLKIEAGRPINRSALAAAIFRELDAEYARICSGRFQEISDEWQEGCTTLGRQVSIRVGDRLIQGRAESLDTDGALLVRSQHGHLERIIGGDVTLDSKPNAN